MSLLKLFDSGELIRPSHDRPNLVHLVRAMASVCGVEDLDVSPPVRPLMDLLEPANHLVFILLDGLGMNLVRRLPPESFLASSLRMELLATCPSTTACALTTITTADYPSRHGVTGWYTHLPDHGLTAMILPFAERFSNQPLVHRGIRPQDVLPLPPVIQRMTHQAMTIVPAFITNTTYNTYSRGGTVGAGYHTIPGAIDTIIEHAASTRKPTYTHLYLPEVDTLCHKLGVEHDSIIPLVLQIDHELNRLANALAGKARIVVSADHGLIDVPKRDQALLLDGDSMLDMLLCPPTGDARMPIFHVRPHRIDDFVAMFNTRFSDRMELLGIEEAQQLELFGPGEMTSLARKRLGDFIAFPFKAATLAYHPPYKALGELFLAVHGGLSPQEMQVPLCVV